MSRWVFLSARFLNSLALYLLSSQEHLQLLGYVICIYGHHCRAGIKHSGLLLYNTGRTHDTVGTHGCVNTYILKTNQMTIL